MNRRTQRLEQMEIETLVEEAFRDLVEKYGFSLVTKNHGRELFFDFNRASETVSISIEVGSRPIVEIIEPIPQTGEDAVPWAEKNGVQRSRRFPKLEMTRNFKDLEGYLQEMATRLFSKEIDWLARSSK